MSSKNVINVFQESYAGQKDVIFVNIADNKPAISSLQEDVKNNFKAISSFSTFFREVFLPRGYPDSVSHDYTSYQIWDTLQAFCSTITGTLSTHAIMKGVGVGDESANPLAATVTWVLKDGTGHIGRILFAWWKGTELDSNSKKWRLAADVLNDMALGLELLLLPAFPYLSTELLCITTAMKAIVGVAGGATRAALTQHHAVRGNLADVSAKDGSQETCVNLCASVLALFILHTITDTWMAWMWFMLFTLLHLYSNYRAVKSVELNVFNSARYLLVIKDYLIDSKVQPVSETNALESVFWSHTITESDLCGYEIKMGCSFSNIMKDVPVMELKYIMELYKTEPFCIIVHSDSKRIFVSMKKNSTPEDALRAYWNATRLGIACSYDSAMDGLLKDVKRHKVIKTLLKQAVFTFPRFTIPRDLRTVHDHANQLWPEFKSALVKAGWSIDRHLISVDEWRGDWGF